MPRQARQRGQSGVYHIILRGINKQILFADNEDREVTRMIQNLAHIRLPAELQNLEKGQRNEILRSIKALAGVSTWQLARLTGLSQSVIARA